MFTYANAHKKLIEIYFMYFGNKIYCIFKVFCIISIPPPKKFFHIFVFLCSCNVFSINSALQFKYQPFHLQGNENGGGVVRILQGDFHF